MPVEFRCTSCGKLLRVPEDSAGRDAQCPSCGAIVPVPSQSDAEPSIPPPVEYPFGEPRGQSTIDSGNPYQSPTYTAQPPVFQSVPGVRSGPPWERDGASLKSFIDTAKLGFAFNLFPDMRRDGGLGPPIWFGIAGGMIGTLVSMVYQIAMLGLQFAAIGAGGGEVGPFEQLGVIGVFVVMIVGGLILAPLMLVVMMFLTGGILHLTLMLLKGNHFPFETTFRVAAYATGVCYLVMIVPVCGPYAFMILMIIVMILGLMSAQEISGGKATAAVLLPALSCCGLYIALLAAIFGMVIATSP